jgi:hypothetical protein
VTELTALPVRRVMRENPTDVGELNRAGADKNRRHLALRRAWDAEHTPGEGLSRAAEGHSRNKPVEPTAAQLRHWFTTTLAPLLTSCRPSEIRRVTGLSLGYAFMIRDGYVPHPRHYRALAGLLAVEPPSGEGR